MIISTELKIKLLDKIKILNIWIEYKINSLNEIEKIYLCIAIIHCC